MPKKLIYKGQNYNLKSEYKSPGDFFTTYKYTSSHGQINVMDLSEGDDDKVVSESDYVEVFFILRAKQAEDKGFNIQTFNQEEKILIVYNDKLEILYTTTQINGKMHTIRLTRNKTDFTDLEDDINKLKLIDVE